MGSWKEFRDPATVGFSSHYAPNGTTPTGDHKESVESFQYVCDAVPLNTVPWNENNVSLHPTMIPSPAIIYLPSHPTMEEWNNIVTAARSGFALTGSAVKGQVGTPLSLMDIGESNDSYFFRVSLPGVKNNDRDFSCEVETDGKVLIKGVTVTGEKRIRRHSEVFEMQSQNLCPPGNFSISFKLPGPIDPKQFSGHFGTDGVLEGIVGKKQS